MKKTDKLLFCCPVPPPIHGQASVSLFIYESYRGPKILLNQNFEQMPWFEKILRTIYTSIKLVIILFFDKPSKIYFTCSRSTLGMFKDIWILFFGSIIYKKKIIVHLHGSDFKTFFSKQILPIKKLLSFLYRNVQIGIVLDEEMKNEFSMFPNLKIFVLNNFYDPILDTYLDLEERRIKANDNIVFLYFSNIMYSKGITFALESFNFLCQKYQNIELRIAGKTFSDTNMDKIEIENLLNEQLKKNARIKYFGTVSGLEKLNFLQSGDVLIFLSKKEAFPISVIEAMRAGLYIISSNVGYHPKIIHQNFGSIVKDFSKESIVDEMEKYIKFYKLEVYRSNLNRLFSKTYYSPETFIQNSNEILNKL